MNSIANYGSDDDSSEEKLMDPYTGGRSYRKPWSAKQDDANYDEVQMSLSEGSSDESKSSGGGRTSSSQHPPRRQQRPEGGGRQHRQEEGGRQRRQEEGGSAHKQTAGRRWDVVRPDPRPVKEVRQGRPARDGGDKREERAPHGSRGEQREERMPYGSKGEREEDRSKDGGGGGRDDDRTRERTYRAEKEDDRSRDRRDERSGKSKERYSSSRDDRYRDRKDRDRRRSRSPRERRRSRSPRRERSRSRSRDRTAGRAGYAAKRYDRTNKERFERPDQQKVEEKPDGTKDRFFVPGITGRFREQIEKRKLLWQKKETTQVQPQQQLAVMGGGVAQVAPPGGSRITKVWEATTFAQDTDGKVANKFKRLMGIRNVGEGSSSATDVLKKQEEMFSSMEQQYEVARTATHTMRGVGLGFGSYQR